MKTNCCYSNRYKIAQKQSQKEQDKNVNVQNAIKRDEM